MLSVSDSAERICLELGSINKSDTTRFLKYQATWGLRLGVMAGKPVNLLVEYDSCGSDR